MRTPAVGLFVAPALLGAFALAPAERPSAAPGAAPIAAVLEGEGVRALSAHERDALSRVYAPGRTPLWSADGAPLPAAREALALLRAAPGRGLTASEACADRIEAALSSAGAEGARLRATADVALSLSLLGLVEEAHRGRVDPRRVGFDYHADSLPHDFARAVRRMAAGENPSRVLDGVEPVFAQFARLKDALARYRRAAAEAPPLQPLASPRASHPGERGAEAERLERLLAALGDLPAAPSASPAPAGPAAPDADGLTEGLRRFQARHGLQADGVLGPATLRALNHPLALRVRQIELALERLRWLPHPEAGPLVVVNVPAFRLAAFGDAGDPRPALQMAVVVGRAARTRTPLFAGRLQQVVFRPWWYPPASILLDEILPAVERSPSYLAANDMEIVARFDDAAPALPPSAANVARLRLGALHLRQRPGPKNALGLVKFVFPNDYAVYMHGTPATSLFARARRDFSHGCIRVEDPAALARFVLAADPEWTSARIDEAMHGERTVQAALPRPLPVIVYYTTTLVRADGTVEFFADLYGQDARLERALRHATSARPSGGGGKGCALLR